MNIKLVITLPVLIILLTMSIDIHGKVTLPFSKLTSPMTVSQNDEFETDNFNDQNKPEAGKSPRKLSKTKAVLFSLIVPGAGQLYADAPGRAELFIGAEVGIWLGYFAFHTYGNWKKNDYVRYATRHAGIVPAGKDDEFYKNLTFYNSLEEYNRSGRIIDPAGTYYLPNTSSNWNWESDDRRMDYRAMRNSSETAFRKASFMIGMAVINRLLSGIDAFRLAQKRTSEIEDDFFSKNNIDIDWSASPFGKNPRFKFAVKHSF